MRATRGALLPLLGAALAALLAWQIALSAHEHAPPTDSDDHGSECVLCALAHVTALDTVCPSVAAALEASPAPEPAPPASSAPAVRPRAPVARGPPVAAA